jgi:hypothetical protein
LFMVFIDFLPVNICLGDSLEPCRQIDRSE